MGWRMRFNRGWCCLVVCTTAWCAPCMTTQADLVGPPIPDALVVQPAEAAEATEPKSSGSAAVPSTAQHVASGAPIETRPLGAAKKVERSEKAAAPGEQQRSAAATAGAASQAMTTVGALILVVALILAAASVFRKLAKHNGSLAGGFGAGGRSPAGLLAVLGRYPVAGGQTLVLLKVDRRVLLLSQTRSGRFGSTVNLSTLCEITEAEDVASILSKASDEEGRSLARTFERVLRASEHDTDKVIARAAAPAPVVDVRRTSAAQRAAATNERETMRQTARQSVRQTASIAAANVLPSTPRTARPVQVAVPTAVSAGAAAATPRTGAESVEAIRRRLNEMRTQAQRPARAFAGVRA